MSVLPGLFVVLSGPSGVGKTTVAHALFNLLPNLVPSVSCTTRLPRPGEVDGQDYHFLSNEDFLQKQKEDYFFETVFLHGAWRGTPKEPALRHRDQGKDTLFVIDGQGGLAIQTAYPDNTLTIGLVPKNLEVLSMRLKSRDQDSPGEIQRRLANAQKEISRLEENYEYIVVNDDLPTCVGKVKAIFEQAKERQASRHATKKIL